MLKLFTDAGSPLLHIECVGGAQAAVYLLRPLTAENIHELRRLTVAIPRSARFLRVQLRAREADQYTMNALRELIRCWRHRGNVHLLFLCDADGIAPAEQAGPVVDAEWGSAAATAAFL